MTRTSLPHYPSFGSCIQELQYAFADAGDTSKYRFGFNTQERDDEIAGEGNLFSAEFWEYDARIGRRWNQDNKPDPSISVYACLLNNPICIVDKRGDTTYRFDKSNNGKYLGMFNTDEYGQFGSYGAISKTKIGNKTLELWDGDVFAFADEVNDPKHIRDGIINKLVYVKNDDIKRILTSQGAFNYKDKNNYWEFYNNSTGGQKFDYSFSVIPIKFASEGASSDPLNKPSPILFLPEGDNIAHNHMNFGNYLWAASGYALGFDKNTLKDAAQANSLLNPGKNGYKRQFDSKDDQFSISIGADHALKYKYRNIMEMRHKAEVAKKSKKKKR